MKQCFVVVRSVSIAALVVFCLSMAAVPTAHADRWMVPASANVSGSAGTNWRTDLRLVNTEDSVVSVRIYFLENGADNGALDTFTNVSVPANGQVQINNVLATRFSFSGTGALLIEAPGNDLVVTSRTYNQVPGGTYGQFIPGVPTDKALAAGEDSYLVFLAKSSDFRTNLGWAATGANAGTIKVTLFNSGGSMIGTAKTYPVKPYGPNQINDIFAAVGAAPTETAYAVVRPTVRLVAYASVVDNRTGDPVAVLAQPYPEDNADLLLQGVARAAGVGTSLWRTDLRILGLDSTKGTVTLAYHPKGTEVTQPLTVLLTVGPGELLALDDVMSSAFDMPSANGALRVTAPMPLITLARTYNQSPGGTYGQSIPADQAACLLKEGDEARLSGVLGGDFRSNALFFNGGPAETELELKLVSRTGSIVGTKTYNLEVGETDQINNVLGFFGAPASGGPYTLIVKVIEGGPVSVGLSVIDSQSDDPTFEGAAKIWFCEISGGGGGGGGGGGACVTLPFPSPGRQVTYHVLTEYDGDTAEGELVRTHHSTDANQSHDTSVMSLDAGMGLIVTVTTESRDVHRVLSNPTGHGEIESSMDEVSAVAGGFQLPDSSSNTTYSPALYVGPFSRWCEGETWTTPSVTETIVSNPGGTTSEPSIPYDGVVDSTSESVTTGAGTFDCVCSTITVTGGQGIGTWTRQCISKDLGVLIKMDIHAPGPGSEIFGFLEATDIN